MTRFAPLFAEVPAVGAGVLVADGWRVVVQAAVVTEANSDGSPLPVWVDVTADVIDLRHIEGTANGAVSRWPVGQLVVNHRHFSALPDPQ